MNTKNIVWTIIIVLAIALALIFGRHQAASQPPQDENALSSEVAPESTQDETVPDQTHQATPAQPSASHAIIKNGMKIETTTAGNGAEIQSGQIAVVNYTGTLSDGTAFDSNIDPKFGHVQPFSFTLGAGQVIKGWDEGVAGMKVGETRTLTIPPELAYGAAGIPGAIPGNATLTFVVTLTAIK
jgi:FKBP-type peptidyl-prolyl cis-trans isomerase